ncbi:L-histidine N(alpha)-methyltransferase [Salinimicrobium flavum]|uniref:L-histidine N(Alpha)-methyltransferase n=1 Tax=Salinimicrobium flavum TaxID=1737065 RepID=A0ABW5IRV0_9FLAO
MMNDTKPPQFETQFAADIFHGLTTYPKTLSSKYFYDKKGDELFQQIMDLPEYYLTGKEYGILEKHREEIAAAFTSAEGFDLIELGAGDGKKTKILLRHFVENEFNFKYLPVDISKNVLDQLTKSLRTEIPGIEVVPKQGMYKKVLEDLAGYQTRKKVILFLGSNIGNLSQEEAVNFLKKISSSMSSEDLFFMGVDQKKDPQTVLDAYNDSRGVTAAFNKNLLTRINRELQANFDPDAFLHWPVYDPEAGTAKSFLVSTKEQTVQINSLNLEVTFREWESIHTEISQKYDDTSVAWLAKEAGLEISGSFSDEQNYFKNYLFKRS